MSDRLWVARRPCRAPAAASSVRLFADLEFAALAQPAFDARSDDKGPEPEGVAVGRIGGHHYAFIGLERVGGIMVYDVTNPYRVSFVDYIDNRDFSVDAQLPDDSTNPLVGDLGPEGLAFIAAKDSPSGKPLLAVGNEVSGTTSVYEIDVEWRRQGKHAH